MPVNKKRTVSVRLVSFFEKINNTSLVSTLTQVNFLAYYAMLGVYAIINVMQLAKPFTGLLGQIAIAATLALCAILNEYIDMSVVVEKTTHDEYSDDKLTQQTIVAKNHPRLGWYLLYAASSCVLALCHFGLTTYNMVWLQLTTISLSPLLSSLYFGVFVSTAVAGALLTYTNSYLKYIKHVLMPGFFASSAAQQAEIESVKKPMPVATTLPTKQPQSFLAKSWSIMKSGAAKSLNIMGKGMHAALNKYLTNGAVMASGTAIGALLYALGDFSQMYGLLFYVAVKNLFVISPAWQLTLSLTFAINTVFERSGIWGYNFRKFVTEQAKEDKSLAIGYAKNGFAKLIIFNWTTRSILTNIRLGCVFLLNIFGALLHFKGVYRFAGVATSLGYYLSQGTQNYFQTRKDAAVPAGSASLVEGQAVQAKYEVASNDGANKHGPSNKGMDMASVNL